MDLDQLGVVIERIGLILLVGCSVEDWRNADLQLDVTATGLTDEDRVRICVEGVEIRQEAVGSGLIGVPGLPPDQDHEITVDAIDPDDDTRRFGRAGPVTLGTSSRYDEVEWVPCLEDDTTCTPCQSGGAQAADLEADWLLAVRLQ